MIKIKGQTSVIKHIYARFLAMLDCCVSAMPHPLFLLSDNCLIVSDFYRSYVYTEESDGNDVYQSNNFTAAIAPTWVVSIGQDPSSEIHLTGIYFNHAAYDSGDDFIVGFQDDL